MERKIYVGDSVYSEVVNAFSLVLTTENGMTASNTIYLDAEILLSILRHALSNGLVSSEVVNRVTKDYL